MEILLFGPYPESQQPPAGGVMAVVYALAQGLSTNPDLHITVAAAHVSARPGLEKDGEVSIMRLRVPRYPRLRLHRTLRQRLVEAGSTVKPDLVHGHGTGYYAAAALDSPWPSLITVHGIIRQEAILSGARSLKERLAWQYDAGMERLVLRRAHHVIAISPYVRRVFDHSPHLHWHDIPNPIADDWFEVMPDPQPGRLLCPARVIHRKGTDVLIRSFAQVVRGAPHAQLRIAGETESMPAFVAYCQHLAAELGIAQQVRWLGLLTRTQLQEEITQAQAIVLPARQETAPVVVAEALAAGCPVVASSVGGLPDMISHDRTGLLVPPEDVTALARALVRVITGSQQRTQWSEQARLSAQPYALTNVLAETVQLYQHVISEKVGSI